MESNDPSANAPSRNANTLRCTTCGYELSHSEQGAREFCPRCKQERVFVLKEGSETSFMGVEGFSVASVYTREMALADGVFVDVTGEARKLGFGTLVTLTRGVWNHYVEGEANEELALRALLEEVRRVVEALVKQAKAVGGDPERVETQRQVKIRGREVSVILTGDEAGRPDVRVLFPEEE